MIKKVYIYTLINPLNNQIFYVGYTNNPTRRINEHIKYKYNPLKDGIIAEILCNKLKPILKIIDECEYFFNLKENMFEHERLEIYYIKKYRDSGIHLTNLTDGGGVGNIHFIPVYQFNEFGEFLKKYDSITEASESVMVSISKISVALDQKINKSSAGFYWFSSMDGIKNVKLRKAAKKNIPIVQYSLEGEFLNKFKGQGEAERVTRIKSKQINKCLRKNGYNQAGGYMWFYENNLPKEIKKYKKFCTRKPISQYDLNDNLITNYNSITEATKILNMSSGIIVSNLKHVTKTCKGFVFTYLNEKPIKFIDKRKLRIKSVLKFNMNGELLNEYSSIKEASKMNNAQQSSISANLRNKNKTAGKFVWKYKNNINNNLN